MLGGAASLAVEAQETSGRGCSVGCAGWAQERGPGLEDNLGVWSIWVIFTAQEEMRSPSASAGEGRAGRGRECWAPGQPIQRPPAPTPPLATHWPGWLMEIMPDGLGRRVGQRLTSGLCLLDPETRAGS